MGKIIGFECNACLMNWDVDIEPMYPEEQMSDEFRGVDVDFDDCPNCGSERVRKKE